MTEELEYRAATVADVNFPKRTIELIVMPYESPTQVGHRGRMITEVVSRGAYDGVERRTSRIRVNRDHDLRRVVGRASALHPSRQEGLVAELRIANTPLGDETLALAEEEILDASAGFALLHDETTGKIKDGAEVWETQTRRRLNHLWLDHIAMTPDPAYEDARVLSVRNAEHTAAEGTPNLDSLKLAELEELYASIDRRYGLR
jgi:HK97 family phage prohead protease